MKTISTLLVLLIFLIFSIVFSQGQSRNRIFLPTTFDFRAVSFVNYNTEFLLEQNYLNPFNPYTRIEFKLLQNSFVSKKIYDIKGRAFGVIFQDFRTSGKHIVNFSATGLPSGVYLYEMKAYDGEKYYYERES